MYCICREPECKPLHTRTPHRAGYKALCITVDAPVLGRRERDLRMKAAASEVQTGSVKGAARSTGQGIARALGSSVDASFAWEDLAWVRELTDMPIVIKGKTMCDVLSRCGWIS